MCEKNYPWLQRKRVKICETKKPCCCRHCQCHDGNVWKKISLFFFWLHVLSSNFFPSGFGTKSMFIHNGTTELPESLKYVTNLFISLLQFVVLLKNKSVTRLNFEAIFHELGKMRQTVAYSSIYVAMIHHHAACKQVL